MVGLATSTRSAIEVPTKGRIEAIGPMASQVTVVGMALAAPPELGQATS